MAFRFFLVGAVAALGFDLPQGIDMDALARSGRAWWHARVAEFELRHSLELAGVEGTTSPEKPVEPVTTVSNEDAAFATVIEDVVASFAAEETIELIEEPEASPRLVAGVEVVAYGPDYADFLNRWADGLSEPAEPASSADLADSFSIESGPEPTQVPIAGIAGSAFSPSSGTKLASEATNLNSLSDLSDVDTGVSAEGRSSGSDGQRLIEAVQLTGQALQAWLALVQPSVSSN